MAEAVISRVSIKIPTFFKTNIAIWLKTVDGAFAISGIVNERTKYYHIISNLPPEILQSVEDKLDDTTLTPYTTLKTALLSRNAPTVDVNVEDLLSRHQLGDNLPSAFLRELQSTMRKINPDANVENDPILKWAFGRGLPTNVREIMSAQDPTANLQTLAAVADRVFQVSKLKQTNVFSVNKPVEHEEDNLEINRIKHSRQGQSSQEFPKSHNTIPHNNNGQQWQNDNNNHQQWHNDNNHDSQQQFINQNVHPSFNSNNNNNDQQWRGGNNRGGHNAFGYGNGNQQQNPRFQSSSGTGNFARGLCHFHARFGFRAFRCVAPCTWTEKN